MKIQLLLIEDVETEQLLISSALKSSMPHIDISVVSCIREAIKILENNLFSVILCDFLLDDGNAFDIIEFDQEAPIIVITGSGNEQVAVEALKKGSRDYIVKDIKQNYLKLLPLAIKKVIREKQKDDMLQFLSGAVRNSSDAVFISDLDDRFLFVNPAFSEYYGYNIDDLEHMKIEVLDVEGKISRTMKPVERIHRSKNGTLLDVSVVCSEIKKEDETTTSHVWIVRDISERKQYEEQLKNMFAEVEKSRDSILDILNHLKIGTVVVDKNEKVIFHNEICRGYYSHDSYQGKKWDELFSFSSEEIEIIRYIMTLVPENREKISLKLQGKEKNEFIIEFDIHNDPRTESGWIFYLYDTTDIEDLRKLIGKQNGFQNLIGKSQLMQNVYKMISDVARFDSTVLVEGETGTGKELVARAIHDVSERSKNSFVAINCAGLSDSLLESQLFGHRKGAFTGAIDNHKGVFETASGGTLLLDEIGDIPPKVQIHLLRVLQEKEIVRLGDSKPTKINVRVIAATHRDLNKEVAEGRFRQDLLYRIRIARVFIPPLKKRREDIPLLVFEFLKQFRITTGREPVEISKEAMKLMMSYSWPGNVREMKSAIEYALISCDGKVIMPGDLPPEFYHLATVEEDNCNIDIISRRHQGETEKEKILFLLEQNNGSRVKTARDMCVSRATFYRKLHKYDIPVKKDSTNSEESKVK